MADAIVITKADGDNVNKAKLASREYQNALHLFPPNQNKWIPKSLVCSSVTGENIEKISEIIYSHNNLTKINGWFEKNRQIQDKFWFNETLKELIVNQYYSNELFGKEIEIVEEKICNGELTSFQAAEDLFKKFTQK